MLSRLLDAKERHAKTTFAKVVFDSPQAMQAGLESLHRGSYGGQWWVCKAQKQGVRLNPKLYYIHSWPSDFRTGPSYQTRTGPRSSSYTFETRRSTQDRVEEEEREGMVEGGEEEGMEARADGSTHRGRSIGSSSSITFTTDFSATSSSSFWPSQSHMSDPSGHTMQEAPSFLSSNRHSPQGSLSTTHPFSSSLVSKPHDQGMGEEPSFVGAARRHESLSNDLSGRASLRSLADKPSSQPPSQYTLKGPEEGVFSRIGGLETGQTLATPMNERVPMYDAPHPSSPVKRSSYNHRPSSPANQDQSHSSPQVSFISSNGAQESGNLESSSMPLTSFPPIKSSPSSTPGPSTVTFPGRPASEHHEEEEDVIIIDSTEKPPFSFLLARDKQQVINRPAPEFSFIKKASNESGSKKQPEVHDIEPFYRNGQDLQSGSFARTIHGRGEETELASDLSAGTTVKTDSSSSPSSSIQSSASKNHISSSSGSNSTDSVSFTFKAFIKDKPNLGSQVSTGDTRKPPTNIPDNSEGSIPSKMSKDLVNSSPQTPAKQTVHSSKTATAAATTQKDLSPPHRLPEKVTPSSQGIIGAPNDPSSQATSKGSSALCPQRVDSSPSPSHPHPTSNKEASSPSQLLKKGAKESLELVDKCPSPSLDQPSARVTRSSSRLSALKEIENQKSKETAPTIALRPDDENGSEGNFTLSRIKEGERPDSSFSSSSSPTLTTTHADWTLDDEPGLHQHTQSRLFTHYIGYLTFKRVVFGGLKDVSMEVLTSMFRTYGPIQRLYLKDFRWSNSSFPPAQGYVDYQNAADAKKAVLTLHQYKSRKGILRVLPFGNLRSHLFGLDRHTALLSGYYLKEIVCTSLYPCPVQCENPWKMRAMDREAMAATPMAMVNKEILRMKAIAAKKAHELEITGSSQVNGQPDMVLRKREDRVGTLLSSQEKSTLVTTSSGNTLDPTSTKVSAKQTKKTNAIPSDPDKGQVGPAISRTPPVILSPVTQEKEAHVLSAPRVTPEPTITVTTPASPSSSLSSSPTGNDSMAESPDKAKSVERSVRVKYEPFYGEIVKPSSTAPGSRRYPIDVEAQEEVESRETNQEEEGAGTMGQRKEDNDGLTHKQSLVSPNLVNPGETAQAKLGRSSMGSRHRVSPISSPETDEPADLGGVDVSGLGLTGLSDLGTRPHQGPGEHALTDPDTDMEECGERPRGDESSPLASKSTEASKGINPLSKGGHVSLALVPSDPDRPTESEDLDEQSTRRKDRGTKRSHDLATGASLSSNVKTDTEMHEPSQPQVVYPNEPMPAAHHDSRGLIEHPEKEVDSELDLPKGPSFLKEDCGLHGQRLPLPTGPRNEEGRPEGKRRRFDANGMLRTYQEILQTTLYPHGRGPEASSDDVSLSPSGQGERARPSPGEAGLMEDEREELEFYRTFYRIWQANQAFLGTMSQAWAERKDKTKSL
ncbi:MAG: hypothetical protein DHS80DRAFT_31428 [Piptocephalis tieghemiana]|nr:MAG: hypothetical protein DHS80DRAFT_31428 [Piptocephalis tieghemiana]